MTYKRLHYNCIKFFCFRAQLHEQMPASPAQGGLQSNPDVQEYRCVKTGKINYITPDKLLKQEPHKQDPMMVGKDEIKCKPGPASQELTGTIQSKDLLKTMIQKIYYLHEQMKKPDHIQTSETNIVVSALREVIKYAEENGQQLETMTKDLYDVDILDIIESENQCAVTEQSPTQLLNLNPVTSNEELLKQMKDHNILLKEDYQKLQAKYENLKENMEELKTLHHNVLQSKAKQIKELKQKRLSEVKAEMDIRRLLNQSVNYYREKYENLVKEDACTMTWQSGEDPSEKSETFASEIEKSGTGPSGNKASTAGVPKPGGDKTTCTADTCHTLIVLCIRQFTYDLLMFNQKSKPILSNEDERLLRKFLRGLNKHAHPYYRWIKNIDLFKKIINGIFLNSRRVLKKTRIFVKKNISKLSTLYQRWFEDGCPVRKYDRYQSLHRRSLKCEKCGHINMVPTGTGNQGKPGKMRRHFPVREKSGNFVKTGKVREFRPKYWKNRKI